MRQTLKTSLYLLVFAISGVIFQISCSNADSQAANPSSLLNKMFYTKGVAAAQTIWTCNYDGSSQTQIPISLPANVTFNGTNGNAYPKIAPDGQTIFFVGWDSTVGGAAIYSCDINGQNLLEIVAPSSASVVAIGNIN